MINKMYRQMFLIRKVEEKLLSLFSEGAMKGTVHTCIGQEACAVGTMLATNRDIDLVFSNHRGHGHVLAYGIPLVNFLGELLGKVSGPSRGIGGSQHMLWKNFMSSGIQGSLLPIGVGAALAEKKKKTGAVSIIFLGDGTMGQGIVYESFNFASLWDIPVVFVLENNGYAQTTKTCDAHAGNIAERAAGFDVECSSINGNDVSLVYSHMSTIINEVRTARRPAFVELQTYRLAAHSKSDDTRSKDEIAQNWKMDPLLKTSSFFSSAELNKIHKEITDEVSKATEEALRASCLSLNVYKQQTA